MSLFSKKIVPAFSWMLVIFLLCLLPGSEFPKFTFLDKIHFDKFVHLCLYAILFWLFYYSKQLSVIVIAIICITQGVFIEFIQGNYIPFREFSFADIVANILGVSLGYISRNKILPLIETIFKQYLPWL